MSRFRHHFPYVVIAGAFALIFIAVAMLGAFFLTRMSVLHEDVTQLREYRLHADMLLTRIVAEAANVRLRQNMTLIAMTEPARAKERALVHESIGAVAAMIDGYERLIDPSEKTMFVRWRDAWNAYVSMNDTLNEKELNQSRDIAVEYYLYEMQDAYRQDFMGAVEADLTATAQIVRQQGVAATVAYEEMRMRVVGALVVLTLLCLFLTLVVARLYTAQLHHPQHILEMTKKLDETMHRIGAIAARIERAAAGPAAPVVQSVSHDLVEQADVLKETVETLLTEVKTD